MASPRLHPETIEQVRQAADIVDVVAEHVVLRKQGRGFVGSCPFHDDKSPSFSVSL
jgi:DNA primase